MSWRRMFKVNEGKPVLGGILILSKRGDIYKILKKSYKITILER